MAMAAMNPAPLGVGMANTFPRMFAPNSDLWLLRRRLGVGTRTYSGHVLNFIAG